MYALVHSPDEFLHSNCDVTLFSNHELAHEEMVRRFDEASASNKYKVLPPDEHGDVLDEEGYYIGVILDNEAWFEDTESKWAIIEVKEV